MALSIVAATHAVQAQTPAGEDLALALRSNVVRIVAHVVAGEQPKEGFGFVVGEDSGQLYIVTADHVVRGDGPDEVDKKPSIIFFQNQGTETPGELLGLRLPRGQGDLAVVRVQTPARFSWSRDALAQAPADRGADVWFVGKLGEWYVPTRPGAVNGVLPSGTIRMDALPVSVGTSGAPLISPNGIVGMIATDAGAFSEATPLEVIRRAIGTWNYPWQLVVRDVTSVRAPVSIASSPAEKPLVVWRVGSPHTGDTPDTTVPLDLQLSAGKVGRRIKIEAFAAKGFAQTFFDAFEKHQEPDVLAFDNYGIIDGITTPLGNFTGLGSSATVRQNLVQVTGSLKDLVGGRGGWQFLISTSRNYRAAKLLALRSPECNANLRFSPLPRDIQIIAPRISAAYLQGAAASLKAYEDADRLVAGESRRDPLQVSETKECGYWGNEHLAFVPMGFSYESAKTIGWIDVLLILRKQQTQWQLLTASTDPISTGDFLNQIPQLATAFQKPWNPGKQPISAKLLSPDDGLAPLPAAGQRFGNFIWQPSLSGDVVAEVVEFAYHNDARLFLRFRSSKLTTDQISDGQLWTTQSQWRWRVWSISDTSAVSFSQARSFPH